MLPHIWISSFVSACNQEITDVHLNTKTAARVWRNWSEKFFTPISSNEYLLKSFCSSAGKAVVPGHLPPISDDCHPDNALPTLESVLFDPARYVNTFCTLPSAHPPLRTICSVWMCGCSSANEADPDLLSEMKDEMLKLLFLQFHKMNYCYYYQLILHLFQGSNHGQ